MSKTHNDAVEYIYTAFITLKKRQTYLRQSVWLYSSSA